METRANVSEGAATAEAATAPATAEAAVEGTPEPMQPAALVPQAVREADAEGHSGISQAANAAPAAKGDVVATSPGVSPVSSPERGGRPTPKGSASKAAEALPAGPKAATAGPSMSDLTLGAGAL